MTPFATFCLALAVGLTAIGCSADASGSAPPAESDADHSATTMPSGATDGTPATETSTPSAAATSPDASAGTPATSVDPIAVHLISAIADGRRLIGATERARSDAPTRARALEAMHDWHRAEGDWLEAQAVPNDACIRAGLASYASALEQTGHGLGLFHHVGLDRSYEVLGQGDDQLTATSAALVTQGCA